MRAEGMGTGSWAYQAGVNVAKPLGAMCRVEKRDTIREGGGPGGGWEDSHRQVVRVDLVQVGGRGGVSAKCVQIAIRQAKFPPKYKLDRDLEEMP
jgi:hypothetical protein